MPNADHVEPSVDPSLNVGTGDETGSALDAAFAAVGGEAPAAPEPQVQPAEQVVNEPVNTEDPGLPAEQPVEQPAVPAETTPATESRVPTDPTPAAQPAAETDPDLKAFDEVKLRSDASEKTKTTFATLKQLSAEKLKAAKAELAAERAAVQKRVDEAVAKAREEALKQAQVPDDVKNELEDLRRLRARVDVESDPKFKEQFDVKRDANYEEVYASLAKFGLKESELKLLKGMPEAERVENITDMAAKLPPLEKLRIEAKLFENVNISSAREQALKDAREQAQKIHAERETQTKAQAEAAAKAREAAVAQFATNELFKKAEIPATTPAEERKRLEAQNAQVDKWSKLYHEVVNDESPLAKAEAAFGLVLAHKFKAELAEAQSKLAAATRELEGIKKRSGITDKGRLVNLPTDRSGARPAASIDPDADSGSALDSLAREHGLA